ncbi:hypothetical protein D3C87_1011610 [compost metagenome]
MPFCLFKCWIIFPFRSQIIAPSNTEFSIINLFLIMDPPNEVFFLINSLASVAHGLIMPFSDTKRPFSKVAYNNLLLDNGKSDHISLSLNTVVPFIAVSFLFLYSSTPKVLS